MKPLTIMEADWGLLAHPRNRYPEHPTLVQLQMIVKRVRNFSCRAPLIKVSDAAHS